jgi:hypothetical protein
LHEMLFSMWFFFFFFEQLDMKTCAAIAGWQAHSHEVAAVQFSADETSIFSVGKDNKVHPLPFSLSLSLSFLLPLPLPLPLPPLTRSHFHLTHKR